jgi:cysteine desulfurase
VRLVETAAIYLDYNATTPVDPRVADHLVPYLTARFGNPSSTHAFGIEAHRAVEEGREQIAATLGVSPGCILFTSGATESDNLAIQGLARSDPRRDEVITFATEHPAVLETCAALGRAGSTVRILPVTDDGQPDLEALARAISSRTALVSVMAANNETGVIGPIAKVADLAHAAGAYVHCDATQALGKIPFMPSALDLDVASFSSHKLYGPKGVGALYVRRSVKAQLQPLVYGGGQEQGLRSGTINTAGCVGFGLACALAASEMPAESVRVSGLRSRLETGLLAAFPDAKVMGESSPRLPNTANVRFPGLDADAFLLATPSIAASTGSACASASPIPSHVLRAMGLSYDQAQECIRFSLGRFTTEEEVVETIKVIRGAMDRLRTEALVQP